MLCGLNYISTFILSQEDFYKADLFKEVAGFEWFRGKKYNKALIDPARSGAIEIVELLPKLGVERLVYVSCNPATLARDTARLIEIGYKLESAGHEYQYNVLWCFY
jgi:23S rRNA (uracil1939-C5)-methyltransferase